jgi:hypothetical protein
MHALNAIFTIVDRDDAPGPGMRVPANEAEKTAQLAGGLAASVVLIVMNSVVIVGAYNLQNLKKRSIICCIPCCSPCIILGIPFGIWALVLLNNPEIKPHFEG